jgi:3'-5' exoribonuclease
LNRDDSPRETLFTEEGLTLPLPEEGEEDMEKQFVRDLVPNARVTSVFAVKSKSLASFRNKPGQYMNLVLCDRTGEIKGRVWDRAEELSAGFEVGDVVLASGRVEEYQGTLQFVLTEVVLAPEGTYDPADLIARSGKSPEELLEGLDAAVAQVTEPYLRALLDSFMTDEDFRRNFAWAPGSKTLHHSYAGGLLEHTLSVVALLNTAADMHPELNRELLITGGLLHDIGKMRELGGAITVDYTDLGRFVGHTVLTDRWVGEKIAQIDGFPTELANLLTHMLLSHHGERDWGAPVVPSTMEACALHFADNLDAQVQGFKQVIQRGERTGGWSEYHPLYQRTIYRGRPSEPGDEAVVPAEDA